MVEIPQFKDSAEAALAGYAERGFHIEYDVWTSDECDALVEHALAFEGRRDSDYRPLMHPHRADPRFLDGLKKARIVSIMESLVDGRVSGLQTEFFFGAPGTQGFAAHQDNFYLEAQHGAFASAWCAMTDVSPENGGLYFYPGTNNEDILPVVAMEGGSGPNQDPNARNEYCQVPTKYEKVGAHLPKGSVFFIHGNLVHGSHQNKSDRFRYALLCTYARENIPFRAGRYSRRTAVNVYE